MLSLWTAVVSALIALAAIALTYKQIKGSRFQQQVDLLFRMEDIFFHRERLDRANAARGILAGNFSEAEPVLDQFETIALLVKKEALDKEMVWHTFFYWMNNYFQACADHIKQRQQQNPNFWRDLSSLMPQLRDFEAQQRRVTAAAIVPSEIEIQQFLAEEAQEASSAA